MCGIRRIRAARLRHQAPCGARLLAREALAPLSMRGCGHLMARNLPASVALHPAERPRHRPRYVRGRLSLHTKPRLDGHARYLLRFAPELHPGTPASLRQARLRPSPDTRLPPSHPNAAQPGMPQSAAEKTQICRALPLVPTGPPAARLLPCAARLPEVLQCDPDDAD